MNRKIKICLLITIIIISKEISFANFNTNNTNIAVYRDDNIIDFYFGFAVKGLEGRIYEYIDCGMTIQFGCDFIYKKYIINLDYSLLMGYAEKDFINNEDNWVTGTHINIESKSLCIGYKINLTRKSSIAPFIGITHQYLNTTPQMNEKGFKPKVTEYAGISYGIGYCKTSSRMITDEYEGGAMPPDKEVAALLIMSVKPCSDFLGWIGDFINNHNIIKIKLFVTPTKLSSDLNGTVYSFQFSFGLGF